MDMEAKYKNEEWKNRYIRRTNRITFAIVVVFAIIHLAGFALRGVWGVTRGILRGANSSTQSMDYDSIGSFTTIDADLAMGNINIEAGEEYAVHVEDFSDDNMPVVKLENGVLKLREKKESFRWLTPNSQYGTITVVLPQDAAPSLNVDLSMGDLCANGVRLGDIGVDASMGSVEFSDCTLSSLDITANMGSINLDGGSFTDGELSADMGSVNINDMSFLSADIKASMGSVDVSGSFDKLSADLSMGSLTVKNDKPDAKYDLSCDMGNVNVNGEDRGSNYVVNMW